jgi:hypothetical protein
VKVSAAGFPRLRSAIGPERSVRLRLWTAVVILLAVVSVCYAAALLLGGQAVPATLAVCITVPPTVVTLIGVVKVSTTARPAFGPVAALTATFVRMIWAVGVVAFLTPRAAEFETTPTALAQWTTGFYLLTLAVETALLWRLLGRAEPKAKGPDDGPAP